MSKKPIICAANWKMNKHPQDTEAFLRDLRRYLSLNFQKDVVIFPPNTSLLVASDVLEGSDIGWGAQNCHYEDKGAFTGENSPQILARLGATHCLVGHSERRALFGEDNDFCAKKVVAVQNHGMIPILCLGETLEQREKGETAQVILDQLKGSLREVDWERPLWIAYEPVWAIGTGKVATPAQANEAHSVLREELKDMVGETKANGIPILYGGSVKPENARELSQEKEVDGFLIGGASLVLDSFINIFNEANIEKK